MERGFIQGKLEIKFLLLYILGRTDAPLDLDTLTDVAMCDSGVSYFDFTIALAELVETEHVVLEQGRYSITDKGRRNGSATEDSLPYSVRVRCDLKLGELNEKLRREQRIKSDLQQEPGGNWRVTMELEGEDTTLFHLSVLVPLQEDGQKLIAKYRSDPEAFYKALRTL